MTLDEFIRASRQMLSQFEAHYRQQNALSPDQFPLAVPAGNTNHWVESISAFKPDRAAPAEEPMVDYKAGIAQIDVPLGERVYRFDVSHGADTCGDGWVRVTVQMDGPSAPHGMFSGESVSHRWNKIGRTHWADFLKGLESSYLVGKLFGHRSIRFDAQATIDQLGRSISSGEAKRAGFPPALLEDVAIAIKQIEKWDGEPSDHMALISNLSEKVAVSKGDHENIYYLVMQAHKTRLADAPFVEEVWPSFTDQAVRLVDRATEASEEGGRAPAMTLGLSDSGVASDLVAKVYGPTEPEYQEISISVFNKDGDCCGDIIVGVNPERELRVAITSDGAGDDDKNIVVYPQRPAEEAVEVDVQNSQLGRKPTP